MSAWKSIMGKWTWQTGSEKVSTQPKETTKIITPHNTKWMAEKPLLLKMYWYWGYKRKLSLKGHAWPWKSVGRSENNKNRHSVPWGDNYSNSQYHKCIVIQWLPYCVLTLMIRELVFNRTWVKYCFLVWSFGGKTFNWLSIYQSTNSIWDWVSELGRSCAHF